MHVKAARQEISHILKAAQVEHSENLQIAGHNARCPVAAMKPYKTAAQRSLVRAVNELIGLVEQTSDN